MSFFSLVHLFQPLPKALPPKLKKKKKKHNQQVYYKGLNSLLRATQGLAEMFLYLSLGSTPPRKGIPTLLFPSSPQLEIKNNNNFCSSYNVTEEPLWNGEGPPKIFTINLMRTFSKNVKINFFTPLNNNHMLVAVNEYLLNKHVWLSQALQYFNMPHSLPLSLPSSNVYTSESSQVPEQHVCSYRSRVMPSLHNCVIFYCLHTKGSSTWAQNSSL